MSYLAQIVTNGLHNGMLYAVLAYGYILLHQVVDRPNLAHGAVFAFSGQVFVMGVNLAYNALIFTFAASLGFGLLATLLMSSGLILSLSAQIIPRFRDSAPNTMIVVTLALAIVMMEAVRIGADGRDSWLPPINTTQLHLGLGAALTQVQAWNIAVMFLLLAGLEFVLTQTSAGRALRAVSQDSRVASLLGINVRRVVVFAGISASALSAIAGLLALLHFGNMSFGAGLTYGLKVLFIASAGGFASPRNAALGAFMFGEAEALWDGYMPIIWREPVFYSFLALLLCLNGKRTLSA